MDPRTKKEFVADFDYEFDEKHKTVSVTERGVAKAEKFLGIDHLYRAENGHLVNHLIQSLKAESLYKRDVDYAVVDGEVKIIDEFTGRILEGRRWSEGLHQAVEAKEGVARPGGEPDARDDHAPELLPHVRQARRHDRHGADRGDRVHEDLQAAGRRDPDQPADGPRGPQRPGLQDQGRQVARGRARDRRSATRTASRCSSARSPSRSPSCSASSSSKRGIKHTVLNAKPEYAEREGETIAEAGRPGAVTIATNMAGRGVDIKLGGNAEHLAQPGGCAKLGLKPGDADYDEHFDAGPARRSRSGSRPTASRSWRPAGCSSSAPSATSRAGSTTSCAAAPAARATPASRASSSPPRTTSSACSPATGSTRSSTASGTVDEEGNEEPIEAGMLSKQIEKAQQKVEEQNFLIRKRVLEYDDVMNEQRRIVYEYRDEVLEGRDMGEVAREQIGRRHRAPRRRVHARRLRRGVGPRRPVRPGSRSVFPLSDRARGHRARSQTEREELDHARSARTRSSSTTSARRSSARS